MTSAKTEQTLFELLARLRYRQFVYDTMYYWPSVKSDCHLLQHVGESNATFNEQEKQEFDCARQTLERQLGKSQHDLRQPYEIGWSAKGLYLKEQFTDPGGLGKIDHRATDFALLLFKQYLAQDIRTFEAARETYFTDPVNVEKINEPEFYKQAGFATLDAMMEYRKGLKSKALDLHTGREIPQLVSTDRRRGKVETSESFLKKLQDRQHGAIDRSSQSPEGKINSEDFLKRLHGHPDGASSVMVGTGDGWVDAMAIQQEARARQEGKGGV